MEESFGRVKASTSWNPCVITMVFLPFITVPGRSIGGGVRGGDVMLDLPILLGRLKMEHLLTQLDGICEQAAKRDLDYQGFLA